MLGCVNLDSNSCAQELINALDDGGIALPSYVGEQSGTPRVPERSTDHAATTSLPSSQFAAFPCYLLRFAFDNLPKEALTAEAANTAMAFPTGDSKALKAYGLPTNVLVDVSVCMCAAEYMF